MHRDSRCRHRDRAWRRAERPQQKNDPRGKGPNHSKTTSDDSSRSDWATTIGHAATKWAAITIGVIMIAGIIMTFFVGAVPPTPAVVREKKSELENTDTSQDQGKNILDYRSRSWFNLQDHFYTRNWSDDALRTKPDVG